MADENKKPRYKDTRYLGLIIAIVAIVVTIIIWLWPIPPPLPSDFSISIDPMLGAIQAGGVIQTTVSVMGITGYDHPVTLSATGQPSGVITAFVPPFGEAKPSYTSSVMITVGKNVPAGDYTLVIKGTGADGKEHSCSYTLTVKPSVTPTSTPTPTPTITTPTPAPTTTISTFENSVSNFRVIDNPSNIHVTVDYTFLSKRGDVAKLAARPLSYGKFPSNFTYSSKIISKGRGTVNLSIIFVPSEKVRILSTDQIEFIMWNDQYGTFFRVPFDYIKIWSST